MGNGDRVPPFLTTALDEQLASAQRKGPWCLMGRTAGLIALDRRSQPLGAQGYPGSQ
jgi:hypothetical protein